MNWIITIVVSLLPLCGHTQSPPDGRITSRVTISDIASFWKAYDSFWQDTTKNPFVDYLANGSTGLQDFIPTRIKSAQALKATVKQERSYYDRIRLSKFDTNEIVHQLEGTLTALREIYPEAILPNVYVVIGRVSSGGTATSNGIIIGFETFSSQPATTSNGRKSTAVELMSALVAHELIHFQQAYPQSVNTLLKLALLEGSANFIATLMGYEISKFNSDAYAYGRLHEQELWKRFVQEKNSEDYSGWLYNFGRAKDVPVDLGYWMGYQICDSYYQHAANKQQAIKAMLHIIDLEKFLTASEYHMKFKP